MATDTDLDDDGILNVDDAFAWDATNGFGTVVGTDSPWIIDFMALGATNPSLPVYETGLTGINFNPEAASGSFDDAPIGVALSSAGLTVAAVGGGDSYQNKNSLTHGYQFGVDVSGMTAFIAGTRIVNPFQVNAPVNYQAQGFQIGTGSQDEYVKLALVAKGGAGGIEVLWESGGVVLFRQGYQLQFAPGLALSDVTDVELDLRVDKVDGDILVTPKWRLFDASGNVIDDQRDDGVQSFTLTGPIAQAIDGTYSLEGAASGLAVGLYGTSAGASPFEATWESIGIKAAPQATSVDLDGDGLLNSADPFALDASNGAGAAVDGFSGLTIDFIAAGSASGGALTPYEAGMTGLNLVPGSTSNLFDTTPADATVTDLGLTVSVGQGDSYKSKNSLTHGYQVGVDVSGSTAFSARTVMVNPFQGFIPQNYQAQGIQIGAGNQNDYIKLALIANGGKGGIEFLWEHDGAVVYRKVFTLDLPSGTALSNVSDVSLGLQVDSGAGSVLVAPTWRLLTANGGVLDDQTNNPVAPIIVTGAIAQAITGTLLVGGAESQLAVGLYATAAGAPPFNAIWENITVLPSEPLDYDADGLLNGLDPFTTDATNGFSNTVNDTSAVHLDFAAIAAAAGGSLSPHEAGLSGLMRNPGSQDNTFAYLPSGAIVSSTGLTIAAVPAGDAYQSQNDLAHGYQIGIDVSAAPAFVVRTTMLNPFRDITPQDYQAQGVQIGAGDQDAYVKLAFIAKGGAGGIEVLWETDGAVAFRQSFTLDLPTGASLADVARIELSLNVDSSTGEAVVTPEWRLLGDGGGLIDNSADDAVQPFTVTGAVAEAIAGTYQIDGAPIALAAGMYATSAGSVPFEATWEALDVQYSEPVVPDYAFSQLALTGTTGLANPTSLEFGPDGRLYVAERFGGIWSYQVEKTTSGYNVTDAQYIDLVNKMPNHDDLGKLTTVVGRQTTGLLMAGTQENPIIYVSSSNPVVGGGPGGEDKNLDTNSGTLSRLTWTGTAWEKVDLVRGLPRSEENHSVNGMILDGDSLYVGVAGHTNNGSPSSKFAYLSEYALSSAVLKVDLAQLDAMPINGADTANPWVYDLPTLDDPTVANVDTDNDGVPDEDPNGVFGGNDGLNMAKFVPGGPIEIFSTGYRNPYDIVMTEDGRIFVTDNGGNPTWGGFPLYDANGLATNNPNPNEDSTSLDSLHLVTAGSHGGHANATRGNTSGAGLTLDSGWTTDAAELPVDWLERNGGIDFLKDNLSKVPVVDAEGRPIAGADGDGSLWGFIASTNGLTEYTATEFAGALQGALITASYDGRVAFLKRDETGETVTDVDYLQILLGNTVPLDVTAQSDFDPFPGTVWVANIGSSQIVVLEPTDPGSVIIDPSIASDADQDGVANVNDAFFRDPNNGMATTFTAGQTTVWDFARDASNPPPLGEISIFGLGFTGVMYNGLQQPGALYDPDNILPSGANPVFQVNYVSEGEAHGGNNSQENGFQFGISFDGTVAAARISSTIDNPFDSTTPAKYQSQGLMIGTGSQFDYISIAVAQHQGGTIEIKQEVADAIVYKQLYTVPDLFNTTDVVLNFDVDTTSGAIRPFWSYTLNGQNFSGSGDEFFAQGETLKAMQGTYSQQKNMPGFTGDIASGLGVGIISTSVGPAEEFTASWADISVEAFAAPPPLPSAFLGITLKNVIDTSTFTSNSFELVNLPENGPELLSMTIDTSTAVLPQVVFDPLGTAGDTGSPKPFTIDTQVGTFSSKATYAAALDGGFQVMRVDFDGFDGGESLAFSVDVDPSNIKGSSPPGPEETGSISGLEMVGSTVTLAFADGSLQTTRIFKDPGKLAGASAVLQNGSPPAPVFNVDSFSWGDTTNVATHTVDVTGTPGSTVRVVVAEGGLYLDGVAMDAPAAEGANKFLSVREYDVAIGTTGQGSTEVLLTDADGTSGVATGWNYIFAAELDGDALYEGVARFGASSDEFLLKYETDDLFAV